MARSIRCGGLVAIVAVLVGFADSGTARGQDVAPGDGLVGVEKECHPCTGDVPTVNVGVDKDLEVLVGWSRYALIPGWEDTGARHSARTDLTFLVDFSKFKRAPGDSRPAPGVTIYIETLGPTSATLIDEAVQFTNVDAETMQIAILTNLNGGIPPTADEVQASQLLSSTGKEAVTYTFKPTFALQHLTGFSCGIEGLSATYPATAVTAKRGRVTLVGPVPPQ